MIHQGIDPKVRQVPASVWNIANALTISRMALVPVFAWLLLYDDPPTAMVQVACQVNAKLRQ